MTPKFNIPHFDISKFKLSGGLSIRLACAGALLAASMMALSAGAQLGVVHLNAGDMKIAFGRGESGLTLDVAARSCPPHCSFDIGWRPSAHPLAHSLAQW